MESRLKRTSTILAASVLLACSQLALAADTAVPVPDAQLQKLLAAYALIKH
jgi:hypothetical protein